MARGEGGGACKWEREIKGEYAEFAGYGYAAAPCSHNARTFVRPG